MMSTLAVPESLLERIEREYEEQPGLNLTSAQAERLWGLDKSTCRAVLSALEDAHVLRRTQEGRFVRASGSTC
jgi:predicted transcriptional regulator